jgi:putative intracellular protease/amidase
LLESFYNSGKPIALVCHSPGVLRHVTYKGEPLVRGKRVTGFTNGEESEVQLTHVVPFLVEDELLRLGATFEKVANWQPFSVVDGHLITESPFLNRCSAELDQPIGAESGLAICDPLANKPARHPLRRTT